MNIIEAIRDEHIFRTYITDSPNGSLDSWGHWLTFLKVLYGLPVNESEHDIVRLCSGRDPAKLSLNGYQECLVLAGRRSGKSKMSALIAAYESVLSGRHEGLSRGEIPMVAVLSPTRFQSRIIHSYSKGVFDSTPMLANELVEQKTERFTLTNGVEQAIITGDPRKVRGFSLIACVVDEIAMFGLSEESKVRSDSELVRSIRPSLVSTGGRLILVGTPYAAKGYAYATYKRHYANNDSDVLVWNAASLLMNPTLNRKIVDRAIAEDPVAANVEYCTQPGLFREDIDVFISRAQVESLVIRGRKELPPIQGITYVAFADVSGGRHDDAALCIAHKNNNVVIIDCLERYRAPHNPHSVVAQMCQTLRRYNCKTCTGDAYAAEWTRTTFETHGINYDRVSSSIWKTGSAAWHKVAKAKSQLYVELLPRLSSGEIELLDDDVLVTQLSSLQRRTSSSGKDLIDHPPGAHDDVSNAVAGAANVAVSDKVFVVRAFCEDDVLPDADDNVLAWKQRLAATLQDEIDAREEEAFAREVSDGEEFVQAFHAARRGPPHQTPPGAFPY